jgi:hypothetical protein
MKNHKMTYHHRRPRSKGGSDREENLSHVLQTQHEAWHTLFVNYDPHEIAFIINQFFLDPLWEFRVVLKE